MVLKLCWLIVIKLGVALGWVKGVFCVRVLLVECILLVVFVGKFVVLLFFLVGVELFK